MNLYCLQHPKTRLDYPSHLPPFVPRTIFSFHLRLPHPKFPRPIPFPFLYTQTSKKPNITIPEAIIPPLPPFIFPSNYPSAATIYISYNYLVSSQKSLQLPSFPSIPRDSFVYHKVYSHQHLQTPKQLSLLIATIYL